MLVLDQEECSQACRVDPMSQAVRIFGATESKLTVTRGLAYLFSIVDYRAPSRSPGAVPFLPAMIVPYGRRFVLTEKVRGRAQSRPGSSSDNPSWPRHSFILIILPIVLTINSFPHEILVHIFFLLSFSLPDVTANLIQLERERHQTKE